jgi:hypothetical protein
MLMVMMMMSTLLITMSNNGGMILKFSEKHLYQCYCAHIKPNTDWSGTETGPPRCFRRPEPWLGHNDDDDDVDKSNIQLFCA